MFDMDRWLKRLWMVNGVLLLILMVLGTGALLVTWLSGAFGSKNAVLAPDPTRAAAVKPRAVRYSPPRPMWGTRSEEHTSELQSRLHLVCRLLLEKKKTKTE